MLRPGLTAPGVSRTNGLRQGAPKILISFAVVLPDAVASTRRAPVVREFLAASRDGIPSCMALPAVAGVIVDAVADAIKHCAQRQR